jgi:hypothetical protein
VRPRRYSPTGLQLEHEQLFGNGLRRDLELSSAEVSTEPDPDGRLVRRPESRRSADLTTFGTKGQMSTYLRLDQTLYAVRVSPHTHGMVYVLRFMKYEVLWFMSSEV